jgi:hypothetical protein
MIKFKYPSNLSDLLEEYVAIFEKNTHRNFDEFFRRKRFDELLINFKSILIAPFHELVYLSNFTFTEDEMNELKTFISYDEYQQKIAKFFMKHQETFKLSTCFYCNMDYIFAYKGFASTLDFVKNAKKHELELIPGIGEVNAKKIIQKRSHIQNLNELTTGSNSITVLKKEAIERFDITSIQYNHFTLDHIIDKATYPLLALSFYNLLPSCYVCNSKLKHSNQLVFNDNSTSPTDKNFTFDKEAFFKLYFVDGESFYDVKNINDFELRLDTSNKFNHYSNLFRLNSRYQFHKQEALELITKQVEYDESHLKFLADTLKIPVNKIRNDIFGKEIFTGSLETKPLTKYKRDIARQIGIMHTAQKE